MGLEVGLTWQENWEEVVSGISNAYECCVACFKTPNCLGSHFGSLACKIVIAMQCPLTPCPQCWESGWYDHEGDVFAGKVAEIIDPRRVFSNGPCGTFLWGKPCTNKFSTDPRCWGLGSVGPTS